MLNCWFLLRLDSLTACSQVFLKFFAMGCEYYLKEKMEVSATTMQLLLQYQFPFPEKIPNFLEGSGQIRSDEG